jgi:16S rRNA (cytidine1402-2'-O)-methyltransferase
MPVIFYEAPHRIRYTLDDLLRRVGDVAILVGRELTKAHEELVRGPISRVLEVLGDPIGELTVVVDIGQTTDITGSVGLPAATDLSTEFGVMTDSSGLTRRQAISKLSRKYSVSAREIFSKLEEAKHSVG